MRSSIQSSIFSLEDTCVVFTLCTQMGPQKTATKKKEPSTVEKCQRSVRKTEMETPHSDRGSSFHLSVWMELSVPTSFIFYCT